MRTPAYRVNVDGADRSSAFGRRLLSVEATDEEGIKSDRVDIELDNADNAIAVPEHGATIKVALGFLETGLTEIGTYVVDSTSGSGPVLTLRVGGKAADMRGGIRAPKTRPWEDKTLKDIASTIAGEHGLTASVGDSIGETKYPFVAQSAESDLHLLTRLASKLDATAKVASERLIVVKRGEGKNASGQSVEPVPISPVSLTDWSWELADRGTHGQVDAEYTDLDTAETKTVSASGGDGPTKRLRRVHSSESEAQASADAELAKSERGVSQFQGEMASFAPGLFAGGLVDLKGFGDHLAGEWHLKSVTHRLDDQGLRSSFTAEKAR